MAENHDDQDDKKYIFDDPKNVKRVIQALYVLCGLSILAELFIHRHIHHSWEVLFGFYGVYGFFACVILVLIAKELRKLVMRGEDYYGD